MKEILPMLKPIPSESELVGIYTGASMSLSSSPHLASQHKTILYTYYPTYYLHCPVTTLHLDSLHLLSKVSLAFLLFLGPRV